MSVEMFKMSVEGFKFRLQQIDDIPLFENKWKHSIHVTGDVMLNENPNSNMNHVSIPKSWINSKIMFDEAGKYWMEVYSETNFHLTLFFRQPPWFFLFSQILNVVRPI